MSDPDSSAVSPRVVVYALIGQDDCLLVARHAEYDALPGGAVQTGEPVEHALRRTVLDQLGVLVADLDFCAVVEHDTNGPGQPPSSELAFLFDVTLTDHELPNEPSSRPHRWAHEHELSSLHPKAVRDELTARPLSSEHPWRAWTP